jgi:hypothetical protein
MADPETLGLGGHCGGNGPSARYVTISRIASCFGLMGDEVSIVVTPKPERDFAAKVPPSDRP